MSRAWLRLTAGVFMAFVVSSAFAQGKGEVPDSLFDKAVEFIKRAKAGIGDRCLTSVTGIACFRGRH